MKPRCICLSFVLLLLITFFSGCSAKQASNAEIKNSADAITEEILVGMNEDNYEKFSANFDQKMKDTLTAEKFKNINAEIKAKIGEYISKEYFNTETKDSYSIIIYKAKFSKETDDVIVRTVLSESNGKIYVSGFWLDSLTLRQ